MISYYALAFLLVWMGVTYRPLLRYIRDTPSETDAVAALVIAILFPFILLSLAVVLALKP